MTIVTAAKYSPISVEEAKLHLRVYHSNQDVLIDNLAKAAVKFVEDYANHYMAEKEICKTYDGFTPLGKAIDLLPGPVNSITKVDYLANASDSTFTELASTRYRLTSSGMRHSVVTLDSWPGVASIAGAVKVTFKAGYTNPASIPLTLKAAAFMILANLYENPGDQIIGRLTQELPKGFEFLVSSQIYRNI